MLTNATIIRITAPGTPGPDGQATYTPAVGTLAIRCAVTQPTRRQQIQLGSIINECTAVARVLSSRLGSQTIGEGYQVEVKVDGRDAVTYLVKHVIDTVKPGISNRAAFLMKV